MSAPMPQALPARQPAAARAPAPRYAIYFAPAPDSGWWRLASVWLGRDAMQGAELAQPNVPGIDRIDLQTLTAAPRRYGFHATLKAPFRLVAGAQEGELLRACAGFARTQRPVELGLLDVAPLSDFLALQPVAPTPALHSFAFACVRALDGLRAPAPPEELARRIATGLTPRQLALLDGWGYPYVDDEFRFHMTLTDRVDEAQSALLLPWLRKYFASVLAKPIVIDAISLYQEAAPGADFRLIEQFPLGA